VTIEQVRSRIVQGPRGPVAPYLDKEAWLDVREGRLGSSDFSALLALDEYSGPWEVWDRVVLGDRKHRDGADIRRGNRQEAVARQVFTELTGLPVEQLPMIAHPKDPRQVSDLDGLIPHPGTWPEQIRESQVWSQVMDQEGPGTLELKVPRVAKYFRLKEEGLTRPYIIQAHHQLEVSGLAWGFFAFYTPEYDEAIAFPIVRDAEFCDWIFRFGQRWWDRHVVQKVRPDLPDGDPPRWPDPVPGVATLRADPEWQEVADVLIERHYEKLALEAEYAAWEEQIVKHLGPDDRHVAGAGVTVKRYSTPQQRRFQPKVFRAAVKLAQKEGNAAALLALDPDDDRFFALTSSSEKVEVKVTAPNPMEMTHGAH
jgi:hypothetical protein